MISSSRFRAAICRDRGGSFLRFLSSDESQPRKNQEFEQSVKELNQKIGDLKIRTKATAEKLYKSVDDVWREAEAKSKKVSINVRRNSQLPRRRCEYKSIKINLTPNCCIFIIQQNVSTGVKEKLSAAKEEVKESFGLGKDKPESKFTSSSSFSEKDGNRTTAGTESSSHSEGSTKESAAQNDTVFGKFKSTFPSASPAVSSAFQKLK